MIVLRSPKGWTGPKTVDGKAVEGYWRAHQVPLADGECSADTAANCRPCPCPFLCPKQLLFRLRPQQL